MRTILVLVTLFSVCTASAATKKKLSSKKLIQNIFTTFEEGKYEIVIEILDDLESRIKKNSKLGKQIQSLVYYWKGMSYSRLNDYELAEEFLKKAVDAKYDSQDLYYEYGQVLYVSEKYKRARIAFKKSVKKKFKMAVSLYYIASISKELKDYKKSVSFYNMLEKLPKEKTQDVIQAARLEIGDIYLMQVEKRRDPFNSIKKYVIPQYRKALEVNEQNRLAEKIREKIENLERKYEITLFRMRNGKPTARPPQYIKATLLYGADDNVTLTSEENKKDLEAKEYAANYYTASFFSRYSFYPSSSFSMAPEVSAAYTKYNSEEIGIMSKNNYFLKGAIKTNFEHIYNDAPATFYFDLDYTYTADDADEDENLDFASTAYGLTLSEELQIFENNPSTFRFNYTTTAAEVETLSTASYGLSYEQIVLLKFCTVFWYNNYNITRFDDATAKASDSNTVTSRVDLIFPTLWGLFNPTVYASIANTNYIEDTDKGITGLTTYGLNMNRPVGRKLYLTADLSSATQVADQDDDNYEKMLMTFSLDYIY